MKPCATCGSVSLPCGCCEGTQPMTPVPIHNAPGLAALAYRVGTHGRFLASMKARLASVTVDVAGADGTTTRLHPLQALTTREQNDPAIALLDGWAAVADVLSFYQERIANEGYLRTATERRSVLELANLVGYRLRPGVAASVYLAYTIDDNQIEPTTIPAGARAQSLPGPGETPQSFETSEPLLARREWNNLPARRRRPQNITFANVLALDRISVSDAVGGLRAGDPILFVFDADGGASALRTVRDTSGPDAEGRSTIRFNPVTAALRATVGYLHTLVATMARYYEGADGATRRAIDRARELQRDALLDRTTEPRYWAGSIINAADGDIEPPVLDAIVQMQEQIKKALDDLDGDLPPRPTSPDAFVNDLLKPRQPQVANSQRLRRDLGTAFARGADAAPQLLLKFEPGLRDTYYAAWARASLDTAPPVLEGVFVLRTGASLFGANVPKQPTFTDGVLNPPSRWLEWELEDESTDGLYLDQLYPGITAPGYAVLRQLGSSARGTQVLPIVAADAVQRTAYGISGKATRLEFDRDWWSAQPRGDMATLRSTLVLTQSEPLALMDEPVEGDVSGSAIELGVLVEDLPSGRWVILSGERADIQGVEGVRASELMMVSALVHGYDRDLPGDTAHTTLHLATPTAFAYRRESLVIHGNVVKATHGETRNEVLGSGDGAQALQSFSLKQPPLTFVAAPTAAGAESTLAVIVDGVRWRETESLAWLGPRDRGFVARTNDEGITTITFGDGEHGARLPTGVQNVSAVYRSGIGAPGNVRADQVSLLTTRPLGVKEVINPLRAAGGADRESRDLARENAPLSVMPLDRLVSVQDYADFTRQFAGIGKAVATQVSDGRRQIVLMTVAGVDDAPIDSTSDLYRNLVEALRRLGDADVPLHVVSRELRALVLSANVALLPDYEWEPVAVALRRHLLERFGFAKRELGQHARLSEVTAAMHEVRGVSWVDIDVFASIPEKRIVDGVRRLITQDEIAARMTGVLQATAAERGTVAAGRRSPPDVLAFPGGLDRGVLRPAELAIFTPEVPDCLVLNQVPS